jgi:magnesium transporter
MESEVVTLRYDEDREAVANVFARYDFIAVPVVDDRFGLLGIVTHDDVLDVVRAEATEDLQRQAGVGPIGGNYLDARFGRVWYSRVTWLALLFLMQMVTIEFMAHYEGRLEGGGQRPDGRGLAFLIVFIPLCLSVGGNAGSQASTLVTRALALEQIGARDWLRVFRRELLMAAALAASLGVLAVARTYFFTPGDVLTKVPEGGFWNLVWVVTFAVMGICLTGAIVGAMLPLGIKAIGGDPALMSSPLIATVSDVLGIVIYFNIITLFF